MNDLRYDLSVLTDPQIFALGRMDPYSDHDVFLTAEEASAQASSLRSSLNGQWKFRYAEDPHDRPVGFEQPACDVSSWADIAVPAHIQLSGYGRPQYVNVQYPWDGHEFLRPPQIPEHYNPVGSYVRTFTIPNGWDGMRVVLAFHGVETAFFCWVNGHFIGYSEDSFTPSRFDITSALHAGENKLAVEVFRFSSASYLEDQDFWRFSGIFRDVELCAFPRAHVHDLFVHAEPDDAFENGVLTTEYRLDLPADAVTLTQTLTDAQGSVVDEASLPAKHDMAILRQISHVQLWSAEAPNLYTLTVALADAQGNAIEVSRTRVGFRRFELRDGLMLINGKRIVFRGADRHEFCPEGGRCITREHMLTDIRNIKRCNINAIRTSHYPNQSEWYRLCDEYGVYLIDECNLETHGSWSSADKSWAVPHDRPEWLPAVLDRAQSMLERDKNHPSILMWSCGNESYGGRDIHEMSEYFHRRDPSRLVHYEGVFHDRRFDSSDVESQMYTTAANVEKYLEEHPEKPFILCEYTHAMGNSCGGMFKYIQLEEKHPRYQGGFIWDFVDQALWVTAPNGKPRLAYGGDFGDRPTDRDFCGDGLFFADRSATPKLQEVKYLYQPILLTPDASGVTVKNRNLFVNASSYDLRWELRLNGKTVQRGVLDAIDVPAGECRRFDLPVSIPADTGEYVLHCGLYLRTVTDWADDELMHGEAIVACIPVKDDAPAADYIISCGDVNTGARSGSFEALFSMAEGGLCSFHAMDGLERIVTAPALSLYRAPTNNDVGNDDWRTEGLWLAASQLCKFKPVSFAQEDGLLCARYRGELPLTGGAAMELSYTVLGNGRIRVELDWPGKDGLPDLEAFGLSLRLPRALKQVSYYGFGPAENYADRMCGAMLGRFAYTADENVTPNLQPQECGNREGVRSLTVTDENGHGLRVDMADAPLSVSVLPYSAYDLMNARHQDELPIPCYTYLDVALCRKGVGGDDSWQAPVHPEYHLPAAQPRRLTFVLSLVR